MSQYHSCLACPSYCPNCQDPLNCLSCNNGYYLSNGTCKECTTQYCFNCDAGKSNICTVCMNGYYLSKSHCKSCPVNCDICDNGTSCMSCSDGYFLSSDGVCTSCLKNCDKCSD